MKKLKLCYNKSVFLIISMFCLAAVLIQGIPGLSVVTRSSIIPACIFLFVLTAAVLIFFHKTGRLTENRMVFAIIFCGMLLHLSYVLLSGLYDRQHDEGVYTGIATSQINPGHIGYIEYIYKFRRLPDMNPYQLFSYYHPPLHYAISGIWLIFLTSLGMPEEMAFENLQVLPLFYSGLFMLLTLLILRKTGAKGKPLYAGILLVALHPSLTIMSGSINNDMLSSLLLACCIYTTLCWIKDKSLKNLILIALSIGLGMLCKINTAIIAFPVGLIFLLDFFSVLRTRNKALILRSLRNYMIFGITAASIGLAWITRNLILFHVKPGISSATEASIMYTGCYSLWSRLGIPSFADWHFSFPFHPLSGDAINNTWVIMFQTSLFAEIFPVELTGLPLLLCRIAYLCAIIFGTSSALLFFAVQYKQRKTKTGLEALFFSAGYLTFLLSFAVFAIKYPYTCSSDFRYIVISLIYIAVGLSGSGRLYANRNMPAICAHIIRIGVCATLILTTIIYMTWKQW